MGCTTTRFELKMHADGGGLVRNLTCWEDGGGGAIANFDQAELERIAEVYGVPTPENAAQRHKFPGTFRRQTPQDIGGRGTLDCSRIRRRSLGETWVYMERFRGNDDSDGQIDEFRSSLDRGTDILIAWFESELSSHPAFPRLRTFLDKEFRRDARNLALTMLLFSEEQDGTGREASIARLLQYLMERDYVSVESLVEISRVMRQDDEAGALRLVRRFVARKMSLENEAAADKALAFLSDVKTAEKSFNRYAKATPWYREALGKWQAEHPDEPADNAPSPQDLAMSSCGLNLKFGKGGASLDIELITGVEPFSTNGNWREETGAVVWDMKIGGGTGVAGVRLRLLESTQRDGTDLSVRPGRIRERGTRRILPLVSRAQAAGTERVLPS